ncbi:sen1 [Guillardia theta]|uniref:Sen1 protein n=1 Tax=Guillardia theta TaxID=55529 RepID=Q9AVZ7_GUITH|nr:hypothetical protein GTHECHR2082 [Guillardia theta]CAC27074.1 sen1 [Guillardia theta]
MESFKNEILGWNFFYSKTNEFLYRLFFVPIVFATFFHFKYCFEPLYFEELRYQINKNIKENFVTDLKIDGIIRSTKIKFDKLFVKIKIKTKSIDKVKNTIGNFFILTIKNDNIIAKKHFFTFFGKVVNIKKKKLIIMEINPIFFLRINKKDKIILFLSRYFSKISLVLKEFETIRKFNYLYNPIRTILMNPVNESIILRNSFFDECIDRHYNLHFNKNQLSCIKDFQNNHITLIQGPPGTGKTRTILGILAILFEEKKKYGIKLKISVDKKKQNDQVIICAPSNAAIDENLSRMLFGIPYLYQNNLNNPRLLRLGPNYNKYLDHISFETLSLIKLSDIDFENKFKFSNFNIINLKRSIINTGSLIFTTLACSNYHLINNLTSKQYLIIDEAAQSIELSSLIPIKKYTHRIILVGDIHQLPATVFSKSAIAFGYNRSLLKRFQLNRYPTLFLGIQYRMHPQISSFPARKFYKNNLKDSWKVSKISNFHQLRCFSPLIFFDIIDGVENYHTDNHFSWCNLDEIRFINLYFRSIICLISNLNELTIGFISGYSGQIEEMRDILSNSKIKLNEQISTIDSFQGKEKDILFFSCVRSKIERGIGFLADGRRINVAFTRAKLGFWIFGNSFSLRKDSNWNETVFDFKIRNNYFVSRKPYERSNRRVIYWDILDHENYTFDGEVEFTNTKILIESLFEN